MNSNKFLFKKQHRKMWSISKGLLIVLALAIFSFRVLVELPLPNVFQFEVTIFALTIAMVIARFTLFPAVTKKMRVTGFELYVLAFMLLIPLFSAWRAFSAFGQPMNYGLLTQRTFLLLGLVLMLTYWMRKGTIWPSHIRMALLSLAWAWLAFTIFFYLFIDPEIFADVYARFATGNQRAGYQYKFEAFLLVFGALFYIFSGALKKDYTAYFLSLPFLIAALLVFDKRSLNIAFLFAVLLTASVLLKKRRLVETSTKLLIAFFVLGPVLAIIFPEWVASVVDKYGAAISVVVKSEIGTDTSSNIRISEFNLALPYIKENWLLGNGDLSSQWNDGFFGKMGYFYPSDLGVIGTIFLYGAMGTCFIYTQFAFLKWKLDSNVGIDIRVLHASCFGMAIFLLIQSLIRGGVMLSPAVPLFFVAAARGMCVKSA